jgi:hypothetical protein
MITEPTEIQKRINAAMLDFGFVEFDGKNEAWKGRSAKQKANYASAAGVIRQLNVAFAKQGLTFETEEKVLDLQRHEKQPGKFVSFAVVQSTIYVKYGDQQVQWQGVGEGTDHGDKATMKASTAAYKYAIAHGMLLGWGAEDPEADESTDRHATEKVAPDQIRANIAKAGSASQLRRFCYEDIKALGQPDDLVKEYQAKMKELKNG